MRGKIKTIGLVVFVVPVVLFLFVQAFPLANMEEHKDLPSGIFNHWVHSHEDDTEAIKVFRPVAYKFPRSRGREGFEIKKNGEFILYRIAPADGLIKLSGKWKTAGKNKITVYFKGHDIGSYSLHIVLCKKEILKIKKRQQ